jgi:nucleotide-binding universal stress UspA family protein
MGSKGASGLEKAIFGTVAAAALELSEVPILIVPPEYAFGPPQHIVLAIDRNKMSEEVCTPVRKLASRFGAEVIGLHVNTGISPSDQHNIELILKDIPHSYREVPASGSINDTIDEFIRTDRCDLLGMIRRKKSFFQNLFQKSVTKTQAYQNSVPLLILPEQ